MKAGKILARTTRRAFRRKLVTFGISSFMCLSLTATGFAAWMLSNDAQKDAAGEIEVASVSEAGVAISNLEFTTEEKNFKLEPAKDDKTGKVRWDGTNCENMSVGIKWTLSNYQNVGETYIEFKLPPTIQKLIDDNYIALPAEFATGTSTTETIDGLSYSVYKYSIPTLTYTEGKNTDTKELNDTLSYTYTKDGEVVNVDFDLTLTLKWGSRFNGKNPSIYFDSDTLNSESDKNYDTVKNTLNELKAAAHGITPAMALDKITDETLKEQLGDASAGVILGHLSEANYNSFFTGNNNKIPPYKVVVYATVA